MKKPLHRPVAGAFLDTHACAPLLKDDNATLRVFIQQVVLLLDRLALMELLLLLLLLNILNPALIGDDRRLLSDQLVLVVLHVQVLYNYETLWNHTEEVAVSDELTLRGDGGTSVFRRLWQTQVTVRVVLVLVSFAITGKPLSKEFLAVFKSLHPR